MENVTVRYYPETAHNDALKHAMGKGSMVERRSIRTGYGQAVCLESIDSNGKPIFRAIVCDAAYAEASNYERGV